MKKIFAFEKSVGAVIYRIENGVPVFLVLKKRNGHWDFPFGHVEPGERELETLKREMREETGLNDLRIHDGFRMSSYFYYVARGNEKAWRLSVGKGNRIFKKVVFFLTETKLNKVITSHEHRGVAWLPFEQALGRLAYPRVKQILTSAYYKINN